MRCVGTVVRGIRTPIIKENDDLATIVVDSLMAAKESEGFEFRDKDIVAITEAVVGISEGNYVTVDDVAEDLVNKFPSKNIGVVNPILSRNRFSIILKGIARGNQGFMTADPNEMVSQIQETLQLHGKQKGRQYYHVKVAFSVL